MRALVIDDHPLVHEIIPAVLAKALGEVAVESEATLEAGLARAGGGAAPDLVLLDLGLPGCEGLEALARFRSKFPAVPLIVLSGNCERGAIVAALEAGAVGYIPKTSKPEVMIAALQVVAAGGTYVPREAIDEPVVEKKAVRRRRIRALDLTQRQKEVLRLILKGYNNDRIAAELAIAPNTVKQHAHAIFSALGVSTRAEAVIAAARHGLSLG
jgi:DNA-binding NarL/FixJ family response regulator